MTRLTTRRALNVAVAGLTALAAVTMVVDEAQAAEAVVRRPVVHPGPAARRVPRLASRSLTIRRRPPVAIVQDEPGFVYGVPQHGWNDPRLYYFGPFRTGGEVFYGDQAGNPITRGNSELGMISGYGGARGGFGGPHFDSVGGFHAGPGPDARIDSDYASGSISTPTFAVVPPRYPTASERVATLNAGVVPSTPAYASFDRAAARPDAAPRERESASDAAKAAFSAPMRRVAPVEAAFTNGGLQSAGFQIDSGEF